ncbi:3-deoxy-manno-octulosonate cytidylyltransferase [uncultured Gammaproteobacteria bacterium]
MRPFGAELGVPLPRNRGVPRVEIDIVIPSRFGSRRFPGKPMELIRGRSLLNRVWSIARAVSGVRQVYVATDDQRIVDHAASFGAKAIMTRPECENGTERVREAIATLADKPQAVLNLQGDAVLTPPWVLQALVEAFNADPSIRLVTPAVRCSWRQLEEITESKKVSPTSGTMVTMDKFGNALYFSKNIIPYLRIKNPDQPPPVYRHIGIYGYELNALEELATLPQTPLEIAEQLEQLRALENGIPIRVVTVDYRNRTHWSVDAPEDVTIAERIIDNEGELT